MGNRILYKFFNKKPQELERAEGCSLQKHFLIAVFVRNGIFLEKAHGHHLSIDM